MNALEGRVEKIEATYRVVTPMFLSGAEQSKAELRLPSIKGALRFWWRALAWGRFNGDLKAIRKEEDELFGSTNTGQAGLLMRLRSDNALIINKGEVLKDGDRTVGDGARYLGYGVMEAFDGRNTVAGRLTRASLAAPLTFQLTLCRHRSISQTQWHHVVNALKLLGLLGGLGSKARKGYGSLILQVLRQDGLVWEAPQDSMALAHELEKFKTNADKPSYTALSRETRFLLVEGNSNESTLSLLNRIGREQVFYRSWGNFNLRNNRHEVLNRQPAEQNFVDDHDLMKALASGGSLPQVSIPHPERVAFGLPHNYFFSSTRDRADVKAVDYTNPRKPVVIDRRASPLFIHIHQVGTKPLSILAFLPSQFLPTNAKIRLAGKSQKDVDIDPTNLWQPIDDFLERMKGIHRTPPLKRHEQFARVVEV